MRKNRAQLELVKLASVLDWKSQQVLRDIEDDLAREHVVSVFDLPTTRAEYHYLSLTSLPWMFTKARPRAKIEDLWQLERLGKRFSHAPVGNICPNIFVIGDAPGQGHDGGFYRQWVSGPSSHLLRRALCLNNSYRFCWFTNQLRHSTPGNRPSEQKEIERGRKWLELETDLLRPSQIYALGNHTYASVKDFFIEKKVHCVRVPHPAFALRGGMGAKEYAAVIRRAIVES